MCFLSNCTLNFNYSYLRSSSNPKNWLAPTWTNSPWWHICPSIRTRNWNKEHQWDREPTRAGKFRMSSIRRRKLVFNRYNYYLFYHSVRVYGPGIEPNGLSVGDKTNFTVETFSAGKGTVDVRIENSKGKTEPVWNL